MEIPYKTEKESSKMTKGRLNLQIITFNIDACSSSIKRQIQWINNNKRSEA